MDANRILSESEPGPGGGRSAPAPFRSQPPGAAGPMAETIAVRPLGGGWRLAAPGLEPLVFSSGGLAERQARRIARGLAACGREAQVAVYDRRDVRVATLRFRAGAAGAARLT